MSGLYSQHLNRPWLRTVRNGLISLVLIALAVATLFPIYYMIVSSFGAPVEAGGASYSLFPTTLLMASTISFGKRAQFSGLPPYSSVRRFHTGDMN